MTAQEFWNIFKSKIKENDIFEEKKVIEVYKNFHDFTRCIINEIDKMIQNDFNLKCNKEYYKIDVVGWTQGKNDEANQYLKEKAESSNLSFYYWDLNVVIEHENNKKEWLDELVKLYYIKCPLKIIITYNYCDNRDQNSKFSDEGKVNIAKDILLQLNKNKNLDEEYLIIFGNAEGFNSMTNEYSNFDYRGYVIKENNFEKLN